MPNRILRAGILRSRGFNALTDDGQLLYYRLISVVDDYGRYELESVDVLRVDAFPRAYDRWPPSRVSEALADVSHTRADDGHPLVIIYSAGNGKKYLQINNFNQRTRSKESKCPSPDSRLAVECQSSDRQVRTETETETETETNTPLPPIGKRDAISLSEARQIALRGNLNVEEGLRFDRSQEAKHLGRAELLDEIFAELREASKQRGVLGGSDTDWLWAFNAWKTLDWTQKLAAIECVRNRDPTDPVMRSLPQNFINGRKWQRPEANWQTPEPRRKTKSRIEAALDLAAQEDMGA